MKPSVSSPDLVLTPASVETRVDPHLLREIIETLARSEPLRAKLEAITQAVCHHLGVHYCAILLERRGDDLLLIEGATGLSASYVSAVNSSYRICIESLRFNEAASSEAFRTGQPVVLADTETDPRAARWRPLFREQGIRSFVSLPLQYHGAVTGTLNCYHSEPRSFERDDLHTLALVASQVAIAVEIARLVETQQQTIGRLEELTTQLSQQRQLLERSAKIHTTLTQMVLNNQGISAISATLAKVLHCPVLVQDQFYQVLAQTDASGVPSTDLEPLTREVLAVHSSAQADRDGRAPFELAANPRRGLHTPRVVAPILAGRQLLGYVSLVVAEVPPQPLTVRALAQAATVLALEMVKERLAYEVEQRVRRGFADDLVAGRFDDAEQMRTRARYLGYDVRGPLQVLLFDIDQFGQYVAEQQLLESDIDAQRRRFFEAVQGVAKTCAPHALVAGRHDQLAVILTAVGERGTKTAPEVIAAVRAACHPLLPDLTISVGIGKPCARLDQVPQSFAQANRALQVIRRLGGRAKAMSYDDLGITRLLFQVENPAELRAFATARLGTVLAYDQRHDGILLRALEAYFSSNQSVLMAAEQLQVHPNTLRYRLHKAEELLKSPLTDVSLLLDLQLACLIVRLVDSPATLVGGSA